MEEIKYIKPDEEYHLKRRAPIPPVRNVPLWVLVPLLLLMVLGGWLVFNGIGKETTGLVEYAVKGDIDYQVYLKENEYYTEKYLGPGLQYIASIISTIRADFDYAWEADEAIDANYQYEIIATAKATDRSDTTRVLYEKTDVLKTSEIKPLENGTITINDNVNVDYNQYNEYMRGFRSDFGIAANCFMDLKLVVKVDGAVKTEDVLAMNIPLSDQTINIGISAEELNREEKVGEAQVRFYTKDLSILIIGGVMAVSSLIISIIVIYLYATRFGDNWYAEGLHNIFKKYDTRIVSVGDTTFYEPEDTVRVESFTELLDASENEGAPIQFFDVDPDYKAYFVVKGMNTTYRYTFSRAYQDQLRKSGEAKEF